MKPMRKAKWIAVGLAGLLVAGVLFVVGGSYIEHGELVKVEKEAYPAPGSLVMIDGDASPGFSGPSGAGGVLHVYAEGEGDPTLVFLAGLGTSAPFFDFKPLFERFSEDYRVAVVERAGYGWSDITGSPRDIGTVLSETRTALRKAGESPPYVLFPHSMAGLEAVYWAQEHPDEVETIIGLDPLVPGYYETAEDRASLSPLVTVLARTGLMRSGPDVFASNFPAMLEGRLTDEEAIVAETVFMRRTNTPDMWEEVQALPENAELVREQGLPEVPFHALISADQPAAWIEAVEDFAQATGGEDHVIEAGHYLHVEEPETVAEIGDNLIRTSVSQER
jgi:pimeloyl-ACP methyl ester carboxylesterase